MGKNASWLANKKKGMTKGGPPLHSHPAGAVEVACSQPPTKPTARTGSLTACLLTDYFLRPATSVFFLFFPARWRLVPLLGGKIPKGALP